MHPVIRFALLLMLACVSLAAGMRVGRTLGSEQRSLSPPKAAVKHPELRVLMIGNSHTAQIPKLLSQMAAAAGTPLHVVGSTQNGATLSDHLARPETSRALHAEHYDIVTLQDQGQYASWSEEAREEKFYPAATALAAAVRDVGAEPRLYAVYARPAGDPGVFPGDTYEAMQDRSDDGYAELGRRIDARVVPVGRAFRAVHALRPELKLWKPDGVHASAQGFYLVAAVFFGALLDQDSTDVRFDGGLPAGDAAFLRRMAAAALGFDDKDK